MPSLRPATGTTRTSFHERPALESSPKTLYQMARLAGYSPVTRLPFTSWIVLIGESRRTTGATINGNARITSRSPGV